MVPPGIPGRSDETFLPAFDPAGGAAAPRRGRLRGPATFPAVTLVTAGTGYDEAIVDQLQANLGITVATRPLDFATLFARLGSAGLARTCGRSSWIADYPSPNDFLGILLGTDQPNNYGGWSNAAFDDAIARAVGTDGPGDGARRLRRSRARSSRDEVPVVPVSYGTSAALARDGLLGARRTASGSCASPAWRGPAQ